MAQLDLHFYLQAFIVSFLTYSMYRSATVKVLKASYSDVIFFFFINK